jgi:hypothetical protein
MVLKIRPQSGPGRGPTVLQGCPNGQEILPWERDVTLLTWAARRGRLLV